MVYKYRKSYRIKGGKRYFRKRYSHNSSTRQLKIRRGNFRRPTYQFKRYSAFDKYFSTQPSVSSYNKQYQKPIIQKRVLVPAPGVPRGVKISEFFSGSEFKMQWSFPTPWLNFVSYDITESVIRLMYMNQTKMKQKSGLSLEVEYETFVQFLSVTFIQTSGTNRPYYAALTSVKKSATTHKERHTVWSTGINQGGLKHGLRNSGIFINSSPRVVYKSFLDATDYDYYLLLLNSTDHKVVVIDGNAQNPTDSFKDLFDYKITVKPFFK